MLITPDYNFNANIHIYNHQDLTIVVDVNSGAIHIVDQVGAALIQHIINSGDFKQAIEATAERFPLKIVQETAQEIIRAWEAGALFSEEEQIQLNLEHMPIKALCLNVAHACNMRCRYCFAGQGTFGQESGLMSLEIGQKAIDFLIKHSQGVKNLEIDFFGGEPLLNFSVVKGIVAYARQQELIYGKKFHFTLTTNSLLLDQEVIDYVIEQELSVILSLDGRPQVNDYNRPLASGQGSYTSILPKIRTMVDAHPPSYYIRGTFTRDNLDFASDVKHIVDQGFTSLSLEPAIGADDSWAIQEEDLPAVLQEYDRLADLLLEYHQQGVDIHFFHFDLDLQRGPCLAKRHSGCGAGVEYLVVTPSGDIYACHQLVGIDEFLMGNVSQGDVDRRVLSTFAANTLTSKEECRKCWARYYCGGGCHANNYFNSGSIGVPRTLTCTMHRKRIEAAIYLDLKKRISN